MTRPNTTGRLYSRGAFRCSHTTVEPYFTPDTTRTDAEAANAIFMAALKRYAELNDAALLAAINRAQEARA